MEEVETLLVEAEALPLVNGEGGGSPRELELIAELVKRAYVPPTLLAMVVVQKVYRVCWRSTFHLRLMLA